MTCRCILRQSHVNSHNEHELLARTNMTPLNHTLTRHFGTNEIYNRRNTRKTTHASSNKIIMIVSRVAPQDLGADTHGHNVVWTAAWTELCAGSTSTAVYSNYYDAPFIWPLASRAAVRPIKITLLPFYLHGQQTNKWNSFFACVRFVLIECGLWIYIHVKGGVGKSWFGSHIYGSGSHCEKIHKWNATGMQMCIWFPHHKMHNNRRQPRSKL